jgi:hypothetical protein
MNKRISLKKVIKLISDKDLRFIILLFLVSLYCLVTAFYSYGKVNIFQLEYIDAMGYDIETDMSGKANYVTFKTTNGARFYITVNGLKKGSASDLAKSLENAFKVNVNTTIYYTNRRVLLPNFYSFSSYHRVVAIETESEAIISVDDYNNAVQGYFIGCIVCSVLFILFSIVLITLYQPVLLRRR